MKPVPPHHLLSAYLDGELASEEREEVERLLAESPEARQELQELQHVGELLRQLPSEALPKSFSAQVLDVCLSDTGQFETETLSEIPATPAPVSTDHNPSNSPRSPRWWRGVAGLGFTLAAAALVLVLVLPDLPNHDSKQVATHTPDERERLEAETYATNSSRIEEQEMAMAPGNGMRDELNDAHIPRAVDGQLQPRTLNPPAKPQDNPVDALASRPSAESLPDPAPKQNLPNPGAGGALDPTAEQVRVVKLVVRDRQRGLDSLQALLQEQKILREEAASAQPGESYADNQNDSTMLAVYVETTEGQ
ncbi:MAG: zf-HC2 domain-containing protein, partial [Planctomycetaceae bacterium]|nr:zf-HC2 domain-containing protein [Planctomycetaceae bacterium]